MPEVRFLYCTGSPKEYFTNVRLKGQWSSAGLPEEVGQILPMEKFRDRNACLAYRISIPFPEEAVGKNFSWGVLLDGADNGRVDLWGITTEFGPLDAPSRSCSFTLDPNGSEERYTLVLSRYLGANKYYKENKEQPGICFSVWAPHAAQVETLIAHQDAGGYIWNNGKGIAETYAMERDGNGIWSTSPDEPGLADYARLHQACYMFRIIREDGSVSLHSDIFSRSQAGKGNVNPEKMPWNGQSQDLESTKSCSVVKDPDFVNDEAPDGTENRHDEEQFWSREFSHLKPLPSNLQDLVIYELHVAGLGAGHDGPGTLHDAMALLDYLSELGVNAVELLPMSEFNGGAGWGYGSSHFHAIKYDPVGQDLFKRFVRACHQRGIAVIVDVVYNHYSPDSERVHWMYDSARHDQNIYFYYHGKEEDYPDFPEGGYSDNMSTGYLPNMRSERVRGMMISSAVNMLLEYHVDGFRMDLTQALHSFNVLHKDGSPLPDANSYGILFMKEWVRTLRLFKPGVFLLAEDHSGWNAMDKKQLLGGIGFDAVWWSEWYHQLIGDANQDDSKARLLKNVGYGTNKALRMNIIGDMLMGTPGRVVYHSSHDESGNSQNSARDIEVAVNGMLFDNTRPWGEARCRVVTGITMLSAGIPMFFMGEEVCAQKPYRYSDFLDNREDFVALKNEEGARMFRYYRDIIRLRKENLAFRSSSMRILKVHNAQRILAWHRCLRDEEFVVIVSLANTPFANGYAFGHRNLKDKKWRQIFDSDAVEYGGAGTVNDGEITSMDGTLNVLIPASGLLVLARIN